MQAQRHLHCCGSGHHQISELRVARQCCFASLAASQRSASVTLNSVMALLAVVLLLRITFCVAAMDLHV